MNTPTQSPINLSLRPYERAAFGLLCCFACVLLAQTVANSSRLATWALDAPCIASKFSERDVLGVPSTDGWDVIRPISIQFQNLSTSSKQGSIRADVFSVNVLGSRSWNSVDVGGWGIDLPTKSLTIGADGSVVFAEYRGYDGVLHRIHIGDLRPEDGAFVPNGVGGGCVSIKSVEYLPNPPEAPNFEPNPIRPRGFRAVPVTIQLPYQYAVWTDVSSPVSFYYGTISITYYVVTPDESEAQQMQ